MAVRKKTILNILLILLVLSFFVTPLGYYGKLLLNRLFSFAPHVIPEAEQLTLRGYDWRLKDAQWDFFNFARSEGRVVFMNFWTSWKLPSEAELSSVQELYDRYKGQVDFYIITDEEREPVEAFMEEHEFTFPVTYRILGTGSPVDPEDSPRSYIIDKKGHIVVNKKGIADWSNSKVYRLMDRLIAEE